MIGESSDAQAMCALHVCTSETKQPTPEATLTSGADALH